MRYRVLSACCALFLTTRALAGDAGMAAVGDIMIHDGWARASIGNAPNSTAYMTLMTHGDAADRLLGASTPAAETAQLHDHIMEDGIARMREVEAVEIAPGEPVTLEPGGLHLMLMGLKQPLQPDGTLALTLTFEKAGDVTLDLPVADLKDAMQRAREHKHGE